MPSVGGRAPRRGAARRLTEIIEPRVEGSLLARAPGSGRTGFDELLGSGVVITGGTTILDGMPELAEQVLGLPVRRGLPTGIGGLVDIRSPRRHTPPVSDWCSTGLKRTQDRRPKAARDGTSRSSARIGRCSPGSAG